LVLINPESCFVEYMFQEFQLLPELARRQPPIDKAKLQNANSVEEALDIARGSLQAAV
jgi:monodehydroascorbate reductase (NADH)